MHSLSMENVGWDHGAGKHSTARQHGEISKPVRINTKALADLIQLCSRFNVHKLAW